jgi:hypothetical protein
MLVPSPLVLALRAFRDSEEGRNSSARAARRQPFSKQQVFTRWRIARQNGVQRVNVGGAECRSDTSVRATIAVMDRK